MLLIDYTNVAVDCHMCIIKAVLVFLLLMHDRCIMLRLLTDALDELLLTVCLVLLLLTSVLEKMLLLLTVFIVDVSCTYVDVSANRCLVLLLLTVVLMLLLLITCVQ